jgi:hypothetical protein
MNASHSASGHISPIEIELKASSLVDSIPPPKAVLFEGREGCRS